MHLPFKAQKTKKEVINQTKSYSLVTFTSVIFNYSFKLLSTNPSFQPKGLYLVFLVWQAHW